MSSHSLVLANDRNIILCKGQDSKSFLQNLITQDITATESGLAYSALLSPQGKYLYDFFILLDPTRKTLGYMIDIDAAVAESFVAYLSRYKLRSNIELTLTDKVVMIATVKQDYGEIIGIDEIDSSLLYQDPRHSGLGWRYYGNNLRWSDKLKLAQKGIQSADSRQDSLRVKYGIPSMGQELIHNESYILEMGFERLKGVDFKKGCYLGQEVTARMHHKAKLSKGLVSLRSNTPLKEKEVLYFNGDAVGVITSCYESTALGYLKMRHFDSTATLNSKSGESIILEAIYFN